MCENRNGEGFFLKYGAVCCRIGRKYGAARGTIGAKTESKYGANGANDLKHASYRAFKMKHAASGETIWDAEIWDAEYGEKYRAARGTECDAKYNATKMRTPLRRISVFFIFLLLIFFAEPSAAITTQEMEDKISCESCLLILENSDQILFSKNADKLMFPASTTKIMTALIVLEQIEDLEEVITIDEESPFTEGSKMFIDVGERIQIMDLLHGLLIHSGNDAARALAVRTAGTEEQFVEMMNDKAMRIGCKNTNFVNPHGLHDENHYTTAHDLYLITAEAMKNPIFASIVAKAEYTIPPTNKQPETRYLYNTNALIAGGTGSYDIIEDLYGNSVQTYYQYATGVKTGYTEEAGRCLISTASDGVNRLYCIVLKSDYDLVFQDSVRLLDYGLLEFQSYELLKANEVFAVHEMRDSQETVIELVPLVPLVSMLKEEPKEGEIRFQVQVDKGLNLPIRAGEPIGRVEAFRGEESLGSVALTSHSDISGRPLLDDTKEESKQPFRLPFLNILFILLEILLAFVVITLAAYFLGLHPHSPR